MASDAGHAAAAATTSSPPTHSSSSQHQQYPLPETTDPRRLVTPAAVKRAIAQLNAHTKLLDETLASTIQSSSTRIAASQASIASLAPQIDLLSEEAAVLQARLAEAAQTSDRISGAVRDLDEERRRIRLAASWVQWTQDLKASLASLAAAIDQGDWERATTHAQKAMAVPKEVIESPFANKTVPSTEQPLPPEQTLQDLRSTLLTVFTQRFKQATEAKDQVEASRFFKLFPLIGWRDEGLGAYCSFARGMIRDKGRAIIDATGRGSSIPLHHAQLLTALFEQLALLIDTHQNVVDRHYGAGNFAAGVMPGLQEECDYIGTRIIDSWLERTDVMRRLDEARAFSFSFLVNLGSTSSTRSAPKAATSASRFGIPGRPGTPASANRPGTPSTAQFDEAQPPDGREVDRLLGELATMSARWATYRRFLKGRLENEPEVRHTGSSVAARSGNVTSGEEGEGEGELKDYRRSSLDNPQRPALTSLAAPEDSISADRILETSTLGQKIDQLLDEVYCPLERWYLRSSLEKAHRIDSPDLAARPFTSSVLDDAFFLVRATLSRLLSTSHLPSISTSLRAFRTIVDEDYVQVLVRRMEGTWRNASGALAGPDGPRKEAATREMRTQFVLYLNVLSVSATYAERILQDLSSEGSLGPLFTAEELPIVSAKLSELSVLPSRLRSATRTEMEHLLNQVTRSRLRNLLTEAYRGVSYDLASDEAFQEAEYHDAFYRRFTRSFNALVLANYKETFTEHNFEAFFAMCVESVVRPWERLILGVGVGGDDQPSGRGPAGTGGAGPPGGMRFTELGALRFDKDWRNVANFLSAHSTSGEVRDKFTRLQQIAYVLSLDEESPEEGEYDDDDDGDGYGDDDEYGVGAGAGGAAGNERDGGGGSSSGERIYNSGAAGRGPTARQQPGGFSWRLSAAEVKAVRALRI